MRRSLIDTTFVIPFFYDSPERLENLNCILKFLYNNFEAHILVIETGEISHSKDFVLFKELHCVYKQDKSGVFHRTKVINDGIKAAMTPYVAVWDTDVIIAPENVLKAVELLRFGASLVYPYTGCFMDIRRTYISTGDIKLSSESYVRDSVGGAFLVNKRDYMNAGLENENIVSWGPEDAERYIRMKILGYTIERSGGICYHIEHPSSPNSGPNFHTTSNNLEYLKVKDMTQDELFKYIKTWPWRQ